MKKSEINKRPKRYFWEIGCIVLGIVFFKFGIDAGFKGSISYNSKGMIGTHNGFMDAFYGFLLIIGGCGSIYSKRLR